MLAPPALRALSPLPPALCAAAERDAPAAAGRSAQTLLSGATRTPACSSLDRAVGVPILRAMVCSVGERLVDGPDEALHRAEVDGRPALVRILGERADAAAIRRLEREWGLRASLDGAWALVPLSLRDVGARRALVLAPFDGVPLAATSRGDLARELALAEAIAAALVGVHGAGLVHGELQPGCVLVDAAGAVRLTCFGGAAFVPERARIQPPAEPGGAALPYMAPEQTGRTRWAVDERADLYALGVILYERLAGRHPFVAADALEWVHAHLAHVAPALAEVDPRVPPGVSELVARLLEKAPDARYQSAHGLCADLARCREALERTGTVAAFPLGRDDVAERLRVPAVLLGRDAERAALLAAWSTAAEGAGPLLVTVSGGAGIGKTALVNELAEPVASRGGRLLFGKFDAYKRDRPYATLAGALDGLVRAILALPEAELAAWRARIAEALGPNARVVIDLVPRLERLLGAAPPPPDVPLSESERRTLLVLDRFVAACASPEAPLALFLDDLQWADPASLRAIIRILANGEPAALLLVCAWRDNEVTPSHPWALALEAIRRQGTSVRDIALGPLGARDTRRLVAAVLGVDAASLARAVHARTGGNPFFVIQMLVTLRQDGLLRFDRAAGGWAWDEARVREVPYSENVVQMLEGALMHLPPRALRATRIAACIGDQGDIGALAGVLGRTVEQAEADVVPAVREGLVLVREGRWRFLHDRVRQAAWQSLPEAERIQTHLRIGRQALDAAGDAVEERIFEIATHFDVAHTAIVNPDERHRVARLNLVAGRRAKASAAWQCAGAYLEMGLDLLGEHRWTRDPGLAFALTLELAQCEWLGGGLEPAERRLLDLLDHARCRDEKAAVYRVLPSLQWMRGKYETSVRTATDGLSLYGVCLGPHPGDDAVRGELAVLAAELGDRPIESLADLPPMPEGDARTAMDMLLELYAPAYITDTNLMCLVSARMVLLSLRHGNAPASPMGYAALGRALGPIFGRYAEGYRFGRLAWDLVEQKGMVAWKGRIADLFGLSSAFWVEPLRTGVGYCRTAFQAANEIGDVSYACWACAHLCHFLLVSGAPLSEVQSAVDAGLDFVRRAGFEEPGDLLVGIGAFVADLRGLTPALATWASQEPDDAAFLERVGRARAPLTHVWQHAMRCTAFVVAGKPAEAVAAGEQAAAYLWSEDPRQSAGTVTQLAYAEFVPYFALAITTRWASAPEHERARLAPALERCEALLRTWVEHAPDNFRHRYAVVRAERARIDGRVEEAMRGYDDAIRDAGRQGFRQHEAFACELAGAFYVERGAVEAGHAYLRHARDAYTQLQAHGNVRQIDARWPELAAQSAVAARGEAGRAGAAGVDVLAVVKASQAVAREIDVAHVEAALLRVVMEQSGARRVLLLSVEGDTARVEAVAEAGAPPRLRVGEPLSAWPSVDDALIRYVIRTGEPVATAASAAERARARSPPAAALCVPILRQGSVVAVLCAENDLAPGAFPPDRVVVTEALAAQAAISIENASLYERLRVLNEELEARVADRTRALEAANRELSAFGYSVSHDLRAPLRAVEGFSAVLESRYASSMPSEAGALLGRIRASARRMSLLIDDMLMLSRITRAEVCRERIDVTALATEVVEALRVAEPGRNVEVVLQPELHANADPRLLRIVLENLFANAWKYSRRRDPARIELFAVGSGDAQVFSIRDNGVGFDPAFADRLFQPFRRLHSEREFEGTGIGLATAQRAIHRHGGRIWADASPDGGATFSFTLAGAS